MNTSLARFKKFLQVRQLGDIEDLHDDNVLKILGKFYTNIRTKKSGKEYKTSSFKVLRVGLNRYFKMIRNIDIIADPNSQRPIALLMVFKSEPRQRLKV